MNERVRGESYSRSLLKRLDGSCSMSDMRLGREAESRLVDVIEGGIGAFPSCTGALSTLSV